MFEELVNHAVCRANQATGLGDDPSMLVVGRTYDVVGITTAPQGSLVTLKGITGNFDASLFVIGFDNHQHSMN